MKNPPNGGCAGLIASVGTALFFCGVFSIEGTRAYAQNVPTYIAIPLALLLSLAPVLLAARAMKRAGARNLGQLMRFSFRRVFCFAASLSLAAGALFAAANPLADCARVLHKLVYDGAAYRSILAFVFVPLAVLCVKGLACITRTGLIMAAPLAASVAAALLTAVPGYDTARLFPLPGCEIIDAASFTASYSFAFLPVLILSLVFPQKPGTHSKTAVKAALFALPFITLSLLAVRLSYPAAMLGGISMPLYRMGLVRPGPGFLLRLDKLLIMLWLAGSIISTALLLRCAGELLSDALGVRKGLTAFMLALICVMSVLAEAHGAERTAVIRSYLFIYGALLTLVPTAAASLAALFKRRMA